MATQAAVTFPTDEYIRSQRISKRRKQQLLDDYLMERRITRTTEALFDRAQALRSELLPAPPHVDAFGFKVLVSKRSFVEGVNSRIVSAHEWAMGQEDFLLQHLGKMLTTATEGRLGVDVEPEPHAIINALEEMSQELAMQGFVTSAYIISGLIGRELYEGLKQVTEDPWDWYRQRDLDQRATYRLVGTHQDIPLVMIEADPRLALYAADLERFATLIRYDVNEGLSPAFTVKEFHDDAEARDVLARQPNLILDPSPSSGQDIDRIRQLQLRVGLELWESYKLEVKDPNAVIARPLADPNYE